MNRNLENAPDWLKWMMDFINRIGFPIMVAIYLGWLQINSIPRMINALEQMSQTMNQVQASIEENTEAVRRLRRER